MHAGIRDTHRRLKPPTKTNARLGINIGAIVWSCFRGDKISAISLLLPPIRPASYLIQDLPKSSPNPASPQRNPPDDRGYYLALRPSNPTKQLSSSNSLDRRNGLHLKTVAPPLLASFSKRGSRSVSPPPPPKNINLYNPQAVRRRASSPFSAEARRCSFAVIVVGTRSPLFAKPPPRNARACAGAGQG